MASSVQPGSASTGSPGADGVLIVSEEPHAPYQRPPLSKAFLSGNTDAATLESRSAEHYERERITLLTAQRVTHARAAAPGRPGVATTEGGGRLEFGHLALAIPPELAADADRPLRPAGAGV
jgi:3-phenylpropionate/trans-cinnamate dioxygenase ferredoxin reductase subunit